MNKMNLQIIDLDKFVWEYDYDSDCSLPKITKDCIKSDWVKFISSKKVISFKVFEELPLENVIFDFDIEISMFPVEKKFTHFECNTLNLYSAGLISKEIICKKLISFASSLEFEKLTADEVDFVLTTVKNSENVSVSSQGFVHTDHGVVLSISNFDLNIGKSKGLTIID